MPGKNGGKAWLGASAGIVAIVAAAVVAIRYKTQKTELKGTTEAIRKAMGLEADAQLHPTAKAMVGWLGKGTDRQKATARFALLLAPAGAAPEVRAASEDATIAPEIRAEMKTTFERQAAARAYWAAQRELEAKWRVAGVAAYDVIGKRNPAWDADARELIGMGVALAGMPERVEERRAEIGKRLRAAKCDDPIVAYLLAHHSKRKETFAEKLAIGRAAYDSQYPTSWRLAALGWALNATTDATGDTVPYPEDEKAQVAKLWRRALAEIGRAEDEGDVSDQRLYVFYVQAGTALRRATGDLDGTWKPIERAFAERHLDSPLRHTILANLHAAAYADLRGRGFAGTVDASRWGKIEEHAAAELAELAAACAGEKPEPNAARRMVDAARQAGLPRAEQDAIFVRAMQLNPDNRDVVLSRSYTLMGRYGNENFREDLTDLIRACALSRNYAADIPPMVAELYRTLYNDAVKVETRSFYENPEMRREAKYVFEDAVRLSPDAYTLDAAFRFYGRVRLYTHAAEVLRQIPPGYVPANTYKPETWARVEPEMRSGRAQPDDPTPDGKPDWAP